jgi:hypothetical protein
MEVPISEGTTICGETIATCKPRDRDVVVLTIQRGSVTIPNPRPDREIMAGDILLCFGKSLPLKSLPLKSLPLKSLPLKSLPLKSLVPKKKRRRKKSAEAAVPTAPTA